MKKRVVWLSCFALILLALDIGSKRIMNHYFDHPFFEPTYPYGGICVFQNVFGIDFCIHRVTNRGGAWGIFACYPYALFAVRMAIFVALFCYIAFVHRLRKGSVSLTLLLTGAAGNLIDFVCYGYVIDFLHFRFWGYSFPVFNFADMMIFFGVFFQLLYPLRKNHGLFSLSRRSTSS